MKKKTVQLMIQVLVSLFLLTLLSGCGRKNDAADAAVPETNSVENSTTESVSLPETETGGKLTDEQALSAIKNYCLIGNPDLMEIVQAEEYPVYWDVSSCDEKEVVVLFRSYTGAQIRYYIDRITGETYVTEFVLGITPEEMRTEERFNVRDYLTGS